MNQKITFSMRVGAALAAGLLASAAQAGTPVAGYIDYAPLSAGASSVPAMGAWTLLFLGLLVAAMAYRVLRGRVGGRMLANTLLVGGVAAAGLGGVDLVQRAEADPQAISLPLSNPAGGTADVLSGVYKVTNTSGVTQRITALRTENGYFYDPEVEGGQRCTTPTTLPPRGVCYIALGAPS